MTNSLDKAMLTKEIEKVFARVAKLTPEEHKNVLGDKWKYINATVEYISAKAIPIIAEAERERIQGELHAAFKAKKLTVNDGVLLWDIIQGVALKERYQGEKK